MIPTSIDGTDITGATIDGTDVQEITVDGDTVFTAGPDIPNSARTDEMVAWYRFEDGDARDYASSAEFPSVTWGDATSYDATITGATHSSSGGVTDFENGSNSGSFEFSSSTDQIDTGNTAMLQNETTATIMCWINPDTLSDDQVIMGYLDDVDFTSQFYIVYQETAGVDGVRLRVNSDSFAQTAPFNIPTGSYTHIAGTYVSGGTCQLVVDGVEVETLSDTGSSPLNSETLSLGNVESRNFGIDGTLDDCRVYSTNLSVSEISAIVSDTQP